MLILSCDFPLESVVAFSIRKVKRTDSSRSPYGATPASASSETVAGILPPPALGFGLASSGSGGGPIGFSDSPAPGSSRPRSFVGHGIGSAVESGSYAYARIQNWLGLGGGGGAEGGLVQHRGGSGDSNPLRQMKRRTSDAVQFSRMTDVRSDQNSPRGSRNPGPATQGAHLRAKSTGTAGTRGLQRLSTGGVSSYDLHLHDVPEITEEEPDQHDGNVVLIEDLQPQSPLTPRSPRSPQFPRSPVSPRTPYSPNEATNLRTVATAGDDRHLSVGFSNATPYGYSIPVISEGDHAVAPSILASEAASDSPGSNSGMGEKTKSIRSSVIGGNRAVFLRTLQGEVRRAAPHAAFFSYRKRKSAEQGICSLTFVFVPFSPAGCQHCRHYNDLHYGYTVVHRSLGASGRHWIFRCPRSWL